MGLIRNSLSKQNTFLHVSEEETAVPERVVSRGRLGCDERGRRGEEGERQGKEEKQDRGAFREAPTCLQYLKDLKDLKHLGEFHNNGG